MPIHGSPTGAYDWHRVRQALSLRHTQVAVDMLALDFLAWPGRV